MVVGDSTIGEGSGYTGTGPRVRRPVGPWQVKAPPPVGPPVAPRHVQRVPRLPLVEDVSIRRPTVAGQQVKRPLGPLVAVHVLPAHWTPGRRHTHVVEVGQEEVSQAGVVADTVL